MRWKYPLALLGFAVVVFVVALGFGVGTVGVSTQDPTPAIAAAEARDGDISGWGMLAGVCLILLSIKWLAVIGVIKLTQGPTVA